VSAIAMLKATLEGVQQITDNVYKWVEVVIYGPTLFAPDLAALRETAPRKSKSGYGLQFVRSKNAQQVNLSLRAN